MTRAFSRRTLLKLSAAAALGGAVGQSALSHAERPARPPLPPEDLAQLRPVLVGRSTTDYLRVHRRPTFDSAVTGWKGYDALLQVFREVAGERLPGRQNSVWYEVEGGYVHSQDVQPTWPARNPVVRHFPRSGRSYLGEITVPYSQALWNLERPDSRAYRLYYSSVYWVSGITESPDGTPYYALYDERLGLTYFAPAAEVRIVPPDELTPLAPHVADKRIVVNIAAQRLTAFEGSAEVLSTTISSGRYRFPTDIQRDGGPPTLTPEGAFKIERKRPSRHMGLGDYVSDYELPGVAWVSYIHWRGYAFHGTYWHNDFGFPHSAGCINMRPHEARWLFRWSQPVAGYDQELVEGEGTRVEIA